MDFAESLARTSDDRLVVVGSSQENRSASSDTDRFATKFVVGRFDAGGALDRSFGQDGHATVEFGDHAEVSDLAFAPDGTLVVVGTTLVQAGDLNPADPDVLLANDFAVARWTRGF